MKKEEKMEQKQIPRSRCVGTAQRGAPILYRACADCIFLAALCPRLFRRVIETVGAIYPHHDVTGDRRTPAMSLFRADKFLRFFALFARK